MQGKEKGVATRILQDTPSALHVHCLAHCINLVLQEASRQCRVIRDALDITGEISSFIRNSPKAAEELKTVAQDMDVKSSSIRPLCPTRWTCRAASIRSVIMNYSSIMSALENVSASGNNDHTRRASGMLALMERFSTLIGLKFAAEVFGITEELSRLLQSPKISAHDTFKAARLTQPKRCCEIFAMIKFLKTFIHRLVMQQQANHFPG